MKDSSDGGVSNVDAIYSASPLLLYWNTDILPLILEPILEYANNKTNVKYNKAWAPHSLGKWPVCDLQPGK
jgi:hypothetical protein